MKVAVMGVGSLGTIVGALMSQKGADVVLIDANKEHVRALNEKGATIVGKYNLNTPVKAITPDEMTGTYDIVFYLVKQTYNEVALKQLLPHLGPDSTVCTLQNGVPEGAVAAIVGKERTMGGPVNWGATWKGPGVSELTSDFDTMLFDLGELDGTITARTKRVAEVLRLAGKVEILDNLLGVRWAKLLVNAMMSGMSAALGCTFGDILDNEKALMCAVHIGNEAIAASRADGISLAPLGSVDMSTLAFTTASERAEKMANMRIGYGPHRPLKASMLQDIEKGLKTEIDAINGIVSTTGKRVGVPTPVCDTVVETVKGIEAGKYTACMKNLDLFTVPEIPA